MRGTTSTQLVLHGTGAGPVSPPDAAPAFVPGALLVNATFEASAGASVPPVADRRRRADTGRAEPEGDTGTDVALQGPQAGDARATVADTRLVRLLAFAGAGDVTVWIDVVHPHAWPVAVPRADIAEDLRAGRLRPRTVAFGGPARPLITEADLAVHPDDAAAAERLRNARAIRDRRWQVIRPLVEDPGQGMFDVDGAGGVDGLLAARARETQTYKKHVRRWVRLFYQQGQTVNTLLPAFQRCGAPGVSRAELGTPGAPKRGRPTLRARAGEVGVAAVGVNVDSDARARLRKGVAHIKAGMRTEEAYRETLRREFYDVEVRGRTRVYLPAPGVAYPTYGQFLHHTRDLRSPEWMARAKHGKAYDRKARPRTGTAAGAAFGPGSEYQIDGTTADCYIVGRTDRSQVLGRPTVYVVVDKFSRMIAGLLVTLGYASWRELAAALLVTFTDKVSYCARFGVAIGPDEWPCVGVPEQIVGDRGEPVAAQGDHAVQALRFALNTTPPYRADWKGLVENKIKFFGLGAARWQPGWVEKAARERGAPDYKQGSRYTLDEFTAYMLGRVLWHNNHRPLKGVRLPAAYPVSLGVPSPRDLWAWGLEHRTGALKSFDPEFLRANLLPAQRCAVYREGIRWSEDLFYTSPTTEAAGLLVRRGRGPLPRVTLAIDPGRVGRAYVRHRDGTYEEARLTDASAAYADWTLDEVEDYRARLTMSAHRRTEADRAARAALDADTAELQASAERATVEAVRAAGRTHVSVGDMKANRRAERRERDAEAARAADTAADGRASLATAHVPSGQVTSGQVPSEQPPASLRRTLPAGPATPPTRSEPPAPGGPAAPRPVRPNYHALLEQSLDD